MSMTRIKTLLIGTALAALSTTACGDKMPPPFEVADRSPRTDREAPFDPPEMYPGWAYDQRSYVQPPEPLAPEPRVKEGDPLHYFTNKKLVLIRRPGDYTPEETPRVGIWWTDNNGFHWRKAGYFGRQQSFFPFEVEEDGDYGIRFVGPGQEPAAQTLPEPERVYHVDTLAPEVNVTIEPEQSWYTPGQTISISWNAEDYHLIESPVRLALLADFTADEPRAIEIQRDLADEGTITFDIPPETLDHEIRFRVDALDRADNLGIAFSYALQVVDETALEDAADFEGPIDEDQTDETEVAAAATPPIFPAGDEMAAAQIASNDETEAVVPFPTAPSREGESDGTLTWDGTAPDVFPTADAPPARRSATGLFEANRAIPTETLNNGMEDVANTNVPPEEAIEPQLEDAPPVSDASSDVSGAARVAPQETLIEPLVDEKAQTADARPVKFDPTRGNGLLVPLPATLVPDAASARRIVAHPWRCLGRATDAPAMAVWSLPRPRFTYGLDRLFQQRYLTDNDAWRPVAEPGRVDSAFAGLPTEEVEAEAIIAP